VAEPASSSPSTRRRSSSFAASELASGDQSILMSSAKRTENSSKSLKNVTQAITYVQSEELMTFLKAKPICVHKKAEENFLEP